MEITLTKVSDVAYMEKFNTQKMYKKITDTPTSVTFAGVFVCLWCFYLGC